MSLLSNDIKIDIGLRGWCKKGSRDIGEKGVGMEKKAGGGSVLWCEEGVGIGSV